MCVYGTTSTRKSSIRGGLNARAACSKALSREEIRFYYSREGVGRMILGTARRLPCYYFASLHFSRGGGGGGGGVIEYGVLETLISSV